MVVPVVSKSITGVSYHAKVEWSHYPYVRIFVFLYSAWLYCYVKGLVFDHNEFFYLSLGVLATLNALTVLSCYWSVSAKVFLTCKRVHSLEKAELVKVTPSAHKGSAALCPLVRHKVTEGGKQVIHTWFEFQKKKFVLDENKKIFHKVSLPLNLPFSEYQSSTGITDDVEEANVRDLYGINQYVCVCVCV